MDGLHVRKTHHIGLALAECSVSVLEYSKRLLKHNESSTFFTLCAYRVGESVTDSTDLYSIYCNLYHGIIL